MSNQAPRDKTAPDSEIESWMTALKEKYGEGKSKQFEKEASIIRVFLGEMKKEVEKNKV